MAFSPGYVKFLLILELMELSERAFLFKLHKRHPRLTKAQMESALNRWYHHRPGAKHGDGVGVRGNPKRFKE